MITTRNLNTVYQKEQNLSPASKRVLKRILNIQLADHYTLLTKTKFYHWKVGGPHYLELRRLFDAQYEEISLLIDQIAEESLNFNSTNDDSFMWFFEQPRVKPHDIASHPSASEIVQELTNDHELLLKHLQKEILKVENISHPTSTINLLQHLIAKHHKMTWLLRQHFEADNLQQELEVQKAFR